MWMLSSTPSAARLRRPNGLILAVAGLLATAGPAAAQQIVFDPRNHLENALQAARQLESLANEARSLAASPYSHMTASSQSLRDMAELARSVRGLATSVSGLERQFETFYPTDLTGADALRILEQSGARTANARRTAEDLARTAAELERLGAERDGRVVGALGASQAAQGQTAAVQSTNQLLAVLAEDLAALRTLLLAQSRLMAEGAAREAAERTSGDAARRQRWTREGAAPAAPVFDPFARARD
jgi:P-type conjugative transfer protein TrbJ